MLKGRVKGVRLPLAQARLEEGEYCPNRCGGKMLVTPDGECTCFRVAPCPACESAFLKCSDCGFEYRNTAEDNQIVDTVKSLWPRKERVDFPSFALYDIFGSQPKRRREVKEID
jgi:hypothetical protein